MRSENCPICYTIFTPKANRKTCGAKACVKIFKQYGAYKSRYKSSTPHDFSKEYLEELLELEDFEEMESESRYMAWAKLMEENKDV